MAEANGSTRLIDISTRKYPNKFAVVDADMFDYLSKWKWCYTKTGYAVRSPTRAEEAENGSRKHIRMHRVVAGICDPLIDVDHKDGNTLNNTRRNLRPSTKAENGRNRKGHGLSGFKGVYLRSDTGRFAAQIKVNRKTKNLGSFNSAEEAHMAYSEAAKRMHGEFCNTGHREDML